MIRARVVALEKLSLGDGDVSPGEPVSVELTHAHKLVRNNQAVFLSDYSPEVAAQIRSKKTKTTAKKRSKK